MSWEWSHTPDTYENGRKRLAKQLIGQLSIALAEWNSTDFDNPDTMEGPQLDTDRYSEELAAVLDEDYRSHHAGVSLRLRKESMADEIWEKAEQLRTCDNGGNAAWVCPYGCHTVRW